MSKFRIASCLTCLVIVATGGLVVRPATAQLQISEVMFDPSSNESRWEWFEVYNPTGSDIDLDGYWLEDFGSAPGPEIMTPGGPGTLPSILNVNNTDPRYTSATTFVRSLNTIVPAGGVAVVFNGSGLTVNNQSSEARFRAAWGLENSPQVRLIGADFFPALNNRTAFDAFGLWATQADMYADTDDGIGGTINSTANAAAGLDFRSGFPDLNNGPSITWSGTTPLGDGTNWQVSTVGTDGAYQSTMTFIPGDGFVNAADIGNPGVIQGGTPNPMQPIYITEIMHNPLSPEPDWEWIELYNSTATAIDLTGYVLDDRVNSALSAANITGGSIEPGGTAILFNGAGNTVENMQAAWGETLNYIPIGNWNSTINLLNSGESIGLWDSLADYLAETDLATGTRTFANAVVSLTYDDSNPWPSTTASNNAKSIFFGNLSLDFTDGNNWTRSEDGMNGSFTATLIPAVTSATDNTGMDIGSPGFFVGAVVLAAPGDFNGDGRVDAADYTLWRDNLGGSDTALAGGSADDTDMLGTVNSADYALWRANFGSSNGSLVVGGEAAVPEPASLVAAGFAFVVGLAMRRRT